MPVSQYTIQWRAAAGAGAVAPFTAAVSSFGLGQLFAAKYVHTITGLRQGAAYEVQVIAVNEMGPGPAAWARRLVDRALVETPRAAPAAIQDGLVVLGPVVASGGSEVGSVRVADSVQSLLVSWTPPADARRAPVTGYLVEWWARACPTHAQTVAGSFQLGFEGQVTGPIA